MNTWHGDDSFGWGVGGGGGGELGLLFFTKFLLLRKTERCVLSE